MSMALEEVCRVLRIDAGAAREREVVATRIIDLAGAVNSNIAAWSSGA
jgi:hypothetical protein